MRAVLFDLDGTLINTGALYAEAYRRAFAAELETVPTWEEMLRRSPASERLFLLDWFGPELGDRVHQRMCESYEALAEELLGGFFEGVYVGDTPMDVEAAHRAGMTGASALWCRRPEDRERLAQKLEPRVWALHAPLELCARLPR